MSQGGSFGTPLFAEKDIVIFLSELGMSASAEQLGKPTYEFVQPIFENLVTALMGVTRCAAAAGCCLCTWVSGSLQPHTYTRYWSYRANRPAQRRRRPTRLTAAIPTTAARSCSSRCSWRSTRWSSRSCTTRASPRWPSSATSAACWRPQACATSASRHGVLGEAGVCMCWVHVGPSGTGPRGVVPPSPPRAAHAAACGSTERCPHILSPPPRPQDLYKPEGPRLRRHLSAILNFAMFREEKLAAYTALQEALEGLLQVGWAAVQGVRCA